MWVISLFYLDYRDNIFTLRQGRPGFSWAPETVQNWGLNMHTCRIWAGFQKTNIIFSFFNVGVIQYFFQHTVTIQSPTGETVDLPYTLACIHWYKVHPDARFYFGLPIQVCLPSFETESVGAFMPVSRIDSVCVVASLRYDLKTPNGKERVTVAVPLDVKLHV